MNRKTWLIVLIAVGAGLAILIGLLGQSEQVAEKQYCDDLTAMQSDLTALTSLDPSTATQDEFQSDVSAVQDDWDSLKSSAQDLQDANQSQLDSAWDSFESAVKGIPDNASVSDAEQSVSSAAQGLESALQSSSDAYTCSSSS